MGILLNVAHRAFDGLFDLHYGISTWGTADDEFHPTSYRLLHRVFKHLDVTPSDEFVDLGCGFGRAVCIAAQYPFARIRGVEIDPITAARARRNVALLSKRIVDDIGIVQGNAATFDCSGATIIYMFNPFNDDTFARVLANIEATIAVGGRPIRLVYVNPVERHRIERCGWLEQSDVLYVSRAGVETIILYQSR